MLTGDFVRMTAGNHEGQTGVIERVGIHDLIVRLTATGTAIAVRRDEVRREFGVPVTVRETLARRERAA